MNNLNLRAGINQRNVAPTPVRKKGNTNAELDKIAKNREERRVKAAQDKADRAKEQKRLEDMGCPGDVDFQLMIENFREDKRVIRQHSAPGENKIAICIRKRPINSKEIAQRDWDSVTCWNPQVLVHYCKLKVDGITKYLDNAEFEFDHTFDERDTTEEIYRYTCAPLVPFSVKKGGRATVFAYGQTGSGKTYTMTQIQEFVARDLFVELERAGLTEKLEVMIAFFEIYGGRCQDLLNRRHRLTIREDGKGEVVIGELQEMQCDDAETLMGYIERGNENRTTHATEKNDVSSRSHAICQIVMRNLETGRMHGKISLIDLAGSERGADTKHHNRQRRMESSEINKSLLALKECIRALDSESSHVPYRASKLTLVLKDSFAKNSSRTVMIATVAPNASSADHTINTLRYADRVKEKKVGHGNNQMPVVERGPSEPKEVFGHRARVASDSCVMEQKLPSDRASEPGLTPPKKYESRLRPPSNIPRRSSEVPAEGKERQWKEAGRRNSDARDPREKKGRPVGRSLLDDSPPTSLSPHRSDSLEFFDNDDSAQDIEYLHSTMRSRADDDDDDEFENEELMEMHRTVQKVFEEEEALLSLHMNVIQETAELLTEEGRLLQQIQGDDIIDYDIDLYATRLEEILQRKQDLTARLQRQLARFRKHLQEEETVHNRLQEIPEY